MSDYKRFFIEKSEMSQNKAQIRSQHNYISKVLRSKVGDKIVLCISDGYDYVSTITKIDSNTVYCDVEEKVFNRNENDFSLTLFFGILKGDKTDFVVQKAVELGATEIVAFKSRFSIADCSESKIARLNKISVSASEQCQRSKAVPFRFCLFTQLQQELSEFDQVLFCYENEDGFSLQQGLQSNLSSTKIAVIVGSEGGFSKEEAEILKNAKSISVSLGKRILRAETASIYALAVIDAMRNGQR